MDEFLQIIRKLWSGERFSFEGRYYQLRDVFVAPRPPRGSIPLFVGAYSEKAMARVAKYGDGYLGAHELYPVYAEKLQEWGKPASTGRFYQASMPLLVAQDPERAMHELAPYYHYVSNMYGVWLNEDHFDDRVQVAAAPKSMSLEEFKASGQLQVLTPGEAIDMFRTMRAKVPVEHVTIAVPPGVPLETYAPYAELFATEVIPAFRPASTNQQNS
jgi:alkanesulfonate monooxygenase SsuD/methylene tetrahydromethanopterin reductase-like flavin-dependent oxidoreductase (luciferase family)